MRTSYLISYAVSSLADFILPSLSIKLETERMARVMYALCIAGCSAKSAMSQQVIDYIFSYQQPDGGWEDHEETVWAYGFISQVMGVHNPAVTKAVLWLKSNRLNRGGWGKHSRDRARIPTTALVLTLVPEAGIDEDYKWVAQEWAKDLSGPVQLSYKAGFYLMVAGHECIQNDSELIARTIRHLIGDQNDDGGFAPWKNHPIGSDPWSTGVVLWGLSKWIDRVDPAVIERALHWLEVTQLPSGYWPYHYLDEGTSYALIGAVSAMRAMASRK